MPRVLIADRFASSRWTIIRALDIARDVQVVGEVAGARRILPQVARTRPQVVLVEDELSLIATDEPTVTLALAERSPWSKTVTL